MTYQESVIDSAFAALADPTRRAVFEAVTLEAQPVGRLAEKFPVSRPAISQHLKVLSDAGLVDQQRVGTRNIYIARRQGVQVLRDYLDRFWDQALASYETGLNKWIEENKA
jgi:DNA-binding transcriptional ArsR family regulator